MENYISTNIFASSVLRGPKLHLVGKGIPVSAIAPVTVLKRRNEPNVILGQRSNWNNES
jgi:hypothetical protein